MEIAADASSYTLKELRCGSLYHLYLSAYNRVGTGSPSDVLSVSTKGSGTRISIRTLTHLFRTLLSNLLAFRFLTGK